MTGNKRRNQRIAFFSLLVPLLAIACENPILQEITKDVELAKSLGAPLIVSTSPILDALDMGTTIEIGAVFSVGLRASSVNTGSFSLRAGEESIPGTVRYEPALLKVVFTPDAPLDFSRVYTATLSTAITSAEGAPFASTYSWSFTTRAANAIAVIETSPSGSAIEPATTSTITATFEGNPDAATITDSTFQVKAGIGAGAVNVAGTVSYNAALKKATFTPAEVLDFGITYTATLTTGIISDEGVPLSEAVSWTFATRAAVVPTITTTNPTASSMNLNTTGTIWANFSTNLNPASISAGSMILKRGTSTVAGTVSYDSVNKRVVFTPAASLVLQTAYTATLKTTITSTEGAPLAAEYVWSFITNAANPDELVIDLTYAGPYLLNSTYPLYLRIFPDPFTLASGAGFTGVVYDHRMNSQGKAILNVASLPSSASGKYGLQIVHDLNSNFAVTTEDDSGDTFVFYNDNGGSNISAGYSAIVMPSPYTFQPTAQLEPGNAYTVTLTDPALVTADAAEPDNDFASASPATLNSAYTRTLDWNDVDIFKFIPDRSESYRIAVASDVTDTDYLAGLSSNFTAKLGVFIYDSAADQVYHVGSDYGDDGTTYGMVEAQLTAGSTYYLQVSGLTKSDTGDYRLKVTYKPAVPDAYESDNTPETGTTPLVFGPANIQARTAEKSDYDYLTFTLPATNGLSTNVAYLFEITKPTYSIRDDLQFSTEVNLNGTHYGSMGQTPFPAQLITNMPQMHPEAGTFFHLRVSNASPYSGYSQPTGEYELAAKAGPDGQDYDFNTGATNQPPRAVGARDDTFTDTNKIQANIGSPTEMKSIWPAGDVDWLQVYWPSGSYPNGVRVAATGPTGGADDLTVRVEFYEQDGTTKRSEWDFGGGTPTMTLSRGYFSASPSGYIYMKVSKSSYEVNKSTGAYQLTLTAVP